jgi:lysozyme
MMIKKRWIKTLFVLLAVLLAAGCQDTDKKEEAKDQADGNKEVYQFVDVLGQQYEAELLEAVPKNTYDLKRIKKTDTSTIPTKRETLFPRSG